VVSNKRNEETTRENNDEEETVKLSFVQLDGKDYCFSKAGHRSNICRYRIKPKSEWVINIDRSNKKDEQQPALVSLEEEEEEEEEARHVL